MKTTQTVVVPASHRLTIDVPPEVPAGPVILTFSPTEVEQKGIPVLGHAKGQFRMVEDSDDIDDVRERYAESCNICSNNKYRAAFNI